MTGLSAGHGVYNHDVYNMYVKKWFTICTFSKMNSDYPTWKTSTYRRKTGFSKGGGPEVYVSPVSAKKPIVFDKRLLEIDNELGEKEEDFLKELREFYSGVARYDEEKKEMMESKRRLAEKSLSLLELAAKLSAEQAMLEQRAEQAQQIMAEPLDDLTHEKQLVEQLEREVEEFKKKLPKTDEKKFEIIDRKMQEAQELAAENVLKEKELQKKRILLEAKQKQMEVEIQELEIMEKDESLRIDDTEASLADTTDERRDDLNRSVEKMKQRMDEVTKRKDDLEEKKRQLEKDKDDFKENGKKQEEEIAELQKKFDDLAQMKREIDEAHIRLDELRSERTQLEIDITEGDDEIARLKRSLEAQSIEKKKIELKNREVTKRRQALEEKLKALEERKKAIQERRDQLAKDVIECRNFSASIASRKYDVEAKEKQLAELESQTPDSELRSTDQPDSEYRSEPQDEENRVVASSEGPSSEV